MKAKNKNFLGLGLVMIALVGCGQQYSVKSGTQSALIDSNVHIEGDLNDVDQDVLDQNDDPVADNDANEDPVNDNDSNDDPVADNDSDNDSNEDPVIGDDDGDDSISCGKNKVLVCHVPPGNPAARHTICISKQGAVHGHGLIIDGKSATSGHKSEDQLGRCK